MATRIVVTGANGAVGQALLRAAAGRGDVEAVAAVRSARAAGAIPAGLAPLERIAYAEPASLERAFRGAAAVVHLPGILVESRASSYEEANVATTEVAVRAAEAAGVKKLVLVSAHGADASARNRYFRTKGEAEARVADASLAWSVLRAPLVLGALTEGTRALANATQRRHVWLLDGGHTLHQPLDVEDLAGAALRAAADPDRARGAVLELAGSERLAYRELVERAAALRGREIRLRSVPGGVVRALVALRTRLLGPGFSPDVLEVLLTDTVVDLAPARTALGFEPTSLATTLRRSLEEAA
jgi:NADH dehydrogenase